MKDSTELEGNQKLSALLRASLAGEIALFAAFFPTEDDEIEVLNTDWAMADMRGRKIYEVFTELNLPGEEDLELCTDLHFNDEESDIALLPGTVIEREVTHAVFGPMIMKLVKLTPEDADFLLGALPDELLEQVALYDD